jgi:hypothetical protein
MSIRTFFTLAAMLVMLVVVASPAFAVTDSSASDAGGTILTTLEQAITGNIGFVIGLGVTILGLWTWIINQETGAGITMIIGGVLITLVPGIFDGARNMMFGVVTTLSGGSPKSVERDN